MRRVSILNNETILQCMRSCLEEESIHHVTVARLFAYLSSHLPMDVPTPGQTSIKAMLKRHFHLKYKAVSPAMVRYIDPTYNEKRLWTARLLA